MPGGLVNEKEAFFAFINLRLTAPINQCLITLPQVLKQLILFLLFSIYITHNKTHET